jgi:hypothetical protein
VSAKGVGKVEARGGRGRTAVSDAVAPFDARLVLQLAGYPVGAGDLVEEARYTCQFTFVECGCGRRTLGSRLVRPVRVVRCVCLRSQ